VQLLVLNAGSSSVKYALFETGSWQRLAAGAAEGIGSGAGRLRHGSGAGGSAEAGPFADHSAALRAIFARLGGVRPEAVGHRVVHGGGGFTAATPVDQEVQAAIEALVELAPLHNPLGLATLEAARAEWPEAVQVAVFDTAFHHTLPPAAAEYPLPAELRRRYKLRRFGFHGISHHYVAHEFARRLDRPLAELNLITLHLGHGASACAIRGGRSVDTSMGMTPLEGLMMATRSGDLDPALPLLLQQRTGMDAAAVERLLNRESGLRGVCGSGDMREVVARAETGEAEATRALEMYAYRVRKYVGAYLAVLGRVDAVIFTGGVGEHAAPLRDRVLAGLEPLGLRVDRERNEALPAGGGSIGRPAAPVALWVVPTDEELAIARESAAVLEQAV